MEKIPVRFTYCDCEHAGILSKVSGGGSTALYYLYIENRFRGQLFFSPHQGYVFASQKGYFPEIAAQLEQYIQ